MRKTSDECGLAAAASFLNRSEITVTRYAKNGTLPCTRDDSGKRRFKIADLKKLKAKQNGGNPHRRSLDELRSSS